ncbi:hypothetical protein PASE110613_02175 [Paenibacillus sediminis]|uniref:Uncharacterized protein n=1 Tax=Paenibacillus sediminis TaxID=664909 RepID=A0ABS4GZD3_9BACL|nr:hypothetical protein [Paenibacillus sediminis]MBP1935606.1 hypothetical protein [Paenibacillus sediminis]
MLKNPLLPVWPGIEGGSSEVKDEDKNEAKDVDKPGEKTLDDAKAKAKPKIQTKDEVKDDAKPMKVPLIASISFFNALGDPIGYITQIIVDPFNIGTKYETFKVLVEPPDKAETAKLTLSIPPSDEGENSYIVDDVTFGHVPDAFD